MTIKLSEYTDPFVFCWLILSSISNDHTYRQGYQISVYLFTSAKPVILGWCHIQLNSSVFFLMSHPYSYISRNEFIGILQLPSHCQPLQKPETVFEAVDKVKPQPNLKGRQSSEVGYSLLCFYPLSILLVSLFSRVTDPYEDPRDIDHMVYFNIKFNLHLNEVIHYNLD